MYENGMAKRRTSENHSIHSYVVDRTGSSGVGAESTRQWKRLLRLIRSVRRVALMRLRPKIFKSGVRPPRGESAAPQIFGDGPECVTIYNTCADVGTRVRGVKGGQGQRINESQSTWFVGECPTPARAIFPLLTSPRHKQGPQSRITNNPSLISRVRSSSRRSSRPNHDKSHHRTDVKIPKRKRHQSCDKSAELFAPLQKMFSN